MKKIIATNRKAFHEYYIDEKYEAGIVLTGTEVKSIRSGKLNFKDSFARLDKNEVFLYNLHISPHQCGDLRTFEAQRPRKLLLHKAEIKKLIGKITEKGLTLVPLSVYFINQHVKVEIGLARGKKLYDKRKTLAEKTMKREAQRELKDREQRVGRQRAR